MRRGTSGGTAAFQNEPISGQAVRVCLIPFFFPMCVLSHNKRGGQRSSNAAMFWGQKAKDKKEPDSN